MYMLTNDQIGIGIVHAKQTLHYQLAKSMCTKMCGEVVRRKKFGAAFCAFRKQFCAKGKKFTRMIVGLLAKLSKVKP